MAIKNILILDDDQFVRAIIRNRLESAGFHCTELSNGKHLSKTFQQYEIDLLITDIVMDEKDGFEVFDEVKMIKGPDFPVIAISSTSTYLLMAEYLGAKAIFQKPVDFDQLLAALQSLD